MTESNIRSVHLASDTLTAFRTTSRARIRVVSHYYWPLPARVGRVVKTGANVSWTGWLVGFEPVEIPPGEWMAVMPGTSGTLYIEELA